MGRNALAVDALSDKTTVDPHLPKQREIKKGLADRFVVYGSN
jgi:hypothetical protein